tara:strand:- start:38 stop:3124 length:3087 start_codon:yes stop_codon:yes gene_type:complete
MSRTAHKLMASSGGVDAYEIDQSLMFNAADTAYLKRTPSSAGNRRTFTLSTWLKTTDGFASSPIFCCSTGTNDASTTYIAFYLGKMYYYGYNTIYRTTNRVFRDVGAWYHFVWAIDSTQSTADNRIRLYVNGVEETSFATKNNPSQNYDFIINSTNEHQLGDEGNQTGGFSPFDGYMAEVNFIDGAQLTPSSFGKTDPISGQWVPKEITGLTYGTNGFYLPFKNSSKSSAYFNGTNSALTTADHTDFTLGTNNFTVECWLNLDETANTDRYFTGITNSTGADANSVFYMNVVGSTKKISCYFYDSSSNYYSVNGNIVITPGKWHHFAFVRNGNVFTVYIDGVSNATRTENITMKDGTNNLSVGRAGETTAAWHNAWKGWISDFRLVNGTAVYTSAFTPPTTSLTAITNTKLLCCNHATVTTESSGTSKTLTITTANSVYSDLISPFAFNYFSDQSGQENDFTETNLLTSDVMLDSPTNNFAVHNSTGSSTATSFTVGNLWGKATSNNFSKIISTIAPTSGKWYCEYYVKGTQHNGSMIGASSRAEGAVVDSSNQNGSSLNDETSWNLQHNTASYQRITRSSNSEAESLGNVSVGDILSIAIDADNSKVYFRKNNTIVGSSSGHTINTLQGGDRYFFAFYPRAQSGYTGHGIANYGQNSSFNGLKIAQGNTDGNGIGDFYYSPPSGFLALCSKNLSNPTIKNGTDHFKALLYAGNATEKTVSGVGFAPDYLWIKNRTYNYHYANVDRVRGANKLLSTSQTAGEYTTTEQVKAFTSDGFTVGDNSDANHYVNVNNSNYIAWLWKANGSGSSNSDGAQTTTVSANTTAGFSIMACTGTGSSTTYGHGLGTTPKVVILKSRSGTDNWYFFSTAADGTTDYYYINTTAAKTDSSTVAGASTITTSFGNGTTFIGYCFAEIEGYSKFATYLGNGAADGPFINTGFKPAYILIKSHTDADNWHICDVARSPGNPHNDVLRANLHNEESADHASFDVDSYSNGFKIRSTNSELNTSAKRYIYMAFAKSPVKYATAR